MIEISCFVSTGLDDRVLKSLFRDEQWFENLMKSIDRTKLVPKYIVDKNGHRKKVYTRIDDEVYEYKKLSNPKIIPEKVSLSETSDPEIFNTQFLKARKTIDPKIRWRVAVHDDLSEYKGCKMYVARQKDGACMAITPDGDIISVCTVRQGTTRGSDLIKTAIKLGGKRLDCYSGLYEFYVKCGLTPVAIVDHNPEYDSDEFKSAKVKSEDIIFFVYDPHRKAPPKSLNEFKEQCKHHFDKDGYDDAAELTKKIVNQIHHGGDKV